MDAEKEQYAVGETGAYNGNGAENGNHPGLEQEQHHLGGKHGNLDEAADLYGNAQEAEEFGYVTRGYVDV